jgi:hypothetical protein
MHHRRATVNDLPRVFAHLADRLADEYHTFFRSQSEPDISKHDAIRKAKKVFRDAIRQGDADALIVDREPIAIVAWQVHEGEVNTSFASNEAFFSSRFVRPMARYVQSLQQRHHGAPLVASNWSGRNDIDRWFSLLGYKLHTELGPLRRFVKW